MHVYEIVHDVEFREKLGTILLSAENAASLIGRPLLRNLTVFLLPQRDGSGMRFRTNYEV
jgi:hypothetical protein